MPSSLLQISFLIFSACLALVLAGGHGGGHKKVIIHVPYHIKNHKHTHTIVKHIHHHHKGGGGDDHYEVLGYTYGEPKPAPHFGGGHGWGAADEGGHDSPVSFEGDHGGYSHSSGGSEYGGY